MVRGEKGEWFEVGIGTCQCVPVSSTTWIPNAEPILSLYRILTTDCTDYTDGILRFRSSGHAGGFFRPADFKAASFWENALFPIREF